MFDQLAKEKDLLRISKSGLSALTWTVLQPFGFIPYPGLTTTKWEVNSLGEELQDPILLLEAIGNAVVERNFKDQDVAMEKTMLSLNRLRTVMARWSSVYNTPVPPSFQWVIHDGEAKLRLIVSDIQGDPLPYVDPTGKTLSEILQIYLVNSPQVSPLDNMLARPKVLRPRIRRVNLEFFKRVSKFAKALASY